MAYSRLYAIELKVSLFIHFADISVASTVYGGAGAGKHGEYGVEEAG